MLSQCVVTMETCVLIPQEFSLVLSSPGSPTLDRLDGVYLKNHNNNDVLKGVGREPVSVWTNARIPQGTVVYPFQGTVRLDTLDVYSQLHDGDVSIPVVMSVLFPGQCPGCQPTVSAPHWRLGGRGHAYDVLDV